MSLAVLRWSAIPLGLLAFSLRLAGHRWLAPLIADRESAADDWIRVAVDLVALVVPASIYLLLAKGDRHRPARFLAENGGLTVPQNPSTAVMQSIIWFFVGAAPFLSGRDLSPPLSAVTLVFSWAGAIVFLLVRRRSCTSTPRA